MPGFVTVLLKTKSKNQESIYSFSQRFSYDKNYSFIEKKLIEKAAKNHVVKKYNEYFHPSTNECLV